MDNNLVTVILFTISCQFHIVCICLLAFLFYKVFKNKIVVAENNREIHEHDKEIFNLQEQVEEIKNG